MNEIKHSMEVLDQASELLDSVEGGVLTGGFGNTTGMNCKNAFICSVALYGVIIDRFFDQQNTASAQ